MFGLRLDPERTRKTEPERLMDAAAGLARKNLRRHPHLSAAPEDPERSWTDVESGASIPPVSCAFRGCRWCGGAEEVTRERIDKRKGIHPWDNELRKHISERHGSRYRDY